MAHVEIASQSQHETGIHLISDIDSENKSRKRPISLSLLSIHGNDWNVGKPRLHRQWTMDFPI